VKVFKTFAIWAIFAEAGQIAYLSFVLPLTKFAVYGTNDDALISSISNGQLAGNPDGHLIFLNPIISFPISWLQHFSSQVNLYIYFLTFVVTLSFSTILGLTQIQGNISLKNRVITIVLWALSCITFVSWFSLSPTYTGASIFAAGASVCFVFMYLSNEKKKDPIKNISFFLFLIMFFTSVSIRLESFYIFIFFVVILLIPKYFFNKIDVRNFALILLSSFLIILTNAVVEKVVYNQNGWKEFYETNQLRHKIQLREPERKLESSYTEIGWDKNTYDLFESFILIDRNKMNSENLQRILDVTSGNQTIKFLQSISFSKIVDNTKLAFAPWTWLVMLFILIVIISFLNLSKRNKVWEFFAQLALIATAIPLLFLYLATSYHLPERISVNLLGGLVLILITIGTQNIQININSKKILDISQILILIVGSILYLQRFQIELKARQDLYLTWRSIGDQQRNFLSALPDDVKVIGTASSIKSDWQNPYSNFQSLDKRNKTFVLGWHNLSPIWTAGINRLNFTKDYLYENLIEDNVYWVINKDDYLLIKEHLTIKLDKEISIEDLGPIGFDQYHYYQLSETELTK
jgi:hypothetical protein